MFSDAGGLAPFEIEFPPASMAQLRTSGLSPHDAFAAVEAMAVALIYPDTRTRMLMHHLGVPATADVRESLYYLADRVDGDGRIHLFSMIFGPAGLAAALILSEEVQVTQPLSANALPEIAARVEAELAERERKLAERVAARRAADELEASALLACAELTGNQQHAVAAWLRYVDHAGLVEGCDDAASLLDQP